MKERIIGAAVLVIFVVLVVPIFLDGPPDDDEIVSERVLLPGQEAQNTQTVVLDRNRTEPVPTSGAAAPAGSDTPVEKPVAQQEKPAVVRQPEPQPETKPAVDEPPARAESAPATSTTGMWAVQLGSFSNKNNAEKLAADLRKQGYAAFLSQLQTGSGVMHRVRIGPQKDRASAEAMAARLAKVGHDGKVVPHP